MIDLRRYSQPLPVCTALEVLGVQSGEVMARLGLSKGLWSMWRSGIRKPSAKEIWGLTLLAKEALDSAEQAPTQDLSEAARAQLRMVMNLARQLMDLQSQLNLLLSPAAFSAAKYQLNSKIIHCIVNY